MKQVTSLMLFLFASITIFAQNDNCEVSMESIKGTYTGDCAKGKANGQGKSVGTDTYEGGFKNGYPEGMGKYTWKNGDSYVGNWKKGVKEGKGEMYTTVDGKLSVTTGFWKKDEYKGKYEKPYIIHNTTTNVGRVEVTRLKSAKNSITIEVQSAIGGGAVTSTSGSATSTSRDATTTKMASLTDIRMQTGSFNSKVSNKLSNKEVNILQNVIFPFKAILMFDNSSVEIELLEDGDWTVVVPIQSQN